MGIQSNEFNVKAHTAQNTEQYIENINFVKMVTEGGGTYWVYLRAPTVYKINGTF